MILAMRERGRPSQTPEKNAPAGRGQRRGKRGLGEAHAMPYRYNSEAALGFDRMWKDRRAPQQTLQPSRSFARSFAIARLRSATSETLPAVSFAVALGAFFSASPEAA